MLSKWKMVFYSNQASEKVAKNPEREETRTPNLLITSTARAFPKSDALPLRYTPNLLYPGGLKSISNPLKFREDPPNRADCVWRSRLCANRKTENTKQTQISATTPRHSEAAFTPSSNSCRDGIPATNIAAISID